MLGLTDRLYIMNQLLKIAKFEPVSHNHEYLVVLGRVNLHRVKLIDQFNFARLEGAKVWEMNTTKMF